jgi:hypothetical protein
MHGTHLNMFEPLSIIDTAKHQSSKGTAVVEERENIIRRQLAEIEHKI